MLEEKKVKQSFEQAELELENVKTELQLNDFKAKYTSKKGVFSIWLGSLTNLSLEDKKKFGSLLNVPLKNLNKQIKAKFQAIKFSTLKQQNEENLDLTLPVNKAKGRLHPITLTKERLKKIFNSMGFKFIDGPEIETDYYNFEALNMAIDHPARDEHDTFYLSSNMLLRTHTSNVQVRTLKPQNLPLSILSIGKTYRKDYDATHTPMFHQMEVLKISKDSSIAELKYIIETFIKVFFNDTKIKFRFRPSFFPFTEPSLEVDMTCPFCKSSNLNNKCRVCKNTGWVEILGSGMVHPNVLHKAGINSKEWLGFALGLGIERLAMLYYGINDLRMFYDNNTEFLAQFN